ncbi:MAG: tripartite tricarboxylate transporter substrate binding protein [Betaproteobacteria bacterium]|nr:tripartite tricarboxylate transporter substrate binding protein [Betaproteobacteria bacterium]
MRATFGTTGLFLAFALALASGAAAAQSYPSKPIKFVVGAAPGGGTDVTARQVGAMLAEQLGQPVLVDNKPGANGIIAADFVAKSEPDGYTLMAGTGGAMVLAAGMYKKLPYDPVKDFIPITRFNLDPLLFAVHPSFPAKSFKELVEMAKAQPGKLFYSSAAPEFQVGTELFNLVAGTKIVHVGFKGASPSITATLSGEVPIIVLSIPPLLPHIRAGKLRPLAIAGTARSSFMPDVPTVHESIGLDFQASTWAGLFAPAGTPRPVIDKLYGALAVVLNSDVMKKRTAAQGRESAGMGMPPAEFGPIHRAEVAKWTKALRELNIRFE